MYLLQWNLPYLDLYYLGTSIVWTAQIGHVTCSLLTIMTFGLDESTRREVAIYLFGSMFILLIITTTWLLGDNGFYHPGE